MYHNLRLPPSFNFCLLFRPRDNLVATMRTWRYTFNFCLLFLLLSLLERVYLRKAGLSIFVYCFHDIEPLTIAIYDKIFQFLSIVSRLSSEGGGAWLFITGLSIFVYCFGVETV